MSTRLLPAIGTDDAPFWRSGADGVLRLQQCRDCDRFQHPPSPRCYRCTSENVSFVPVSGRGAIYSLSINHQPWLPGLAVPYAVVVIAPDEDPDLRLVSRIVGEVDLERPPMIGDRVRVVFEEHEGVFLPFFEVHR